MTSSEAERMITNSQSGTNIQEVADGIFRINTPVSMSDGPGQFNFNQYLIVDDAPMVFHTGQRALFPLVSEAIQGDHAAGAPTLRGPLAFRGG